MKIEIEKIRRLDIKPGETLVVTVPSNATGAGFDRIERIMKERVPDGVEILVISSDIKLDVVAKSRKAS